MPPAGGRRRASLPAQQRRRRSCRGRPVGPDGPEDHGVAPADGTRPGDRRRLRAAHLRQPDDLHRRAVAEIVARAAAAAAVADAPRSPPESLTAPPMAMVDAEARRRRLPRRW